MLGLFLCVGIAVANNYAVIVLSSFKTLRALREIGSESATFAAINRQLNYIFALQVRDRIVLSHPQTEWMSFRQ